ncbi:8913_t:CDS:1, partial [Racocetra fulgida]
KPLPDWFDKVVILKVSKTNEIIGRFVSHGNQNENFIFSLKNETQKESILSKATDFNRPFRISFSSSFDKLFDGSFYKLFNGKPSHRLSKDEPFKLFVDNMDSLPQFGSSGDLKKWYYKNSNYYTPIRETDGWFLVDDYEVFKIVKK